MSIDGERNDARTGRLEMVDGRYVLRFERRLPHPVEKVWRAITEPEHLVRWYPTHRELEPRAGGEVRESDLPGDGELPGDGDLSGDGDLPGAGVPLGHQTVPGPLADHRPTALAAWHIQLELLALHLEGDGPCWPEERTEELRAYYARRLT